jgi:hypothetical protein
MNSILKAWNNARNANTDGWGNKLVTVFAFAPAPKTNP